MAVCVRMVGQELRACVQYRPPLQCSRQRCTGPRRAVPQQPACPRAHHERPAQAASQLLVPANRLATVYFQRPRLFQFDIGAPS